MTEYITAENLAALETELQELTGKKRKEIVAQIEYAKSLGDLSENAEYHQAREEQGKLEERISQIEYVLRHAEIAARPTNGLVSVGATVTIQKEGETTTRTFQVVGSEETDMLSGKISYKSPLGAALSGKKKGEQVTVSAPKGDTLYTIIDVA